MLYSRAPLRMTQLRSSRKNRRTVICSVDMHSFLLATFLAVQGPMQVTEAQQPAVQSQQPDPQIHSADTGGLTPKEKGIVPNIWYDQKKIWTSPLRINRKNAGWWVLFGGATAALIATDDRTSNVLPNTTRQISISRNVSRIGAVYTTLPAAGAFYFYGKFTKNPTARETGVLGTEALLDSYILVSVLKIAAGRERPELPGGDGRFFKGKNSFPSGHTLMSWSFASVIAHEYKDKTLVPVVAYSLATVVGASRFAQRKHFASDVVAGGAMGWFIGRYVFVRHSAPSVHHAAKTPSLFNPVISPSIAPHTHEYGLSLAWNLSTS